MALRRSFCFAMYGAVLLAVFGSIIAQTLPHTGCNRTALANTSCYCVNSTMIKCIMQAPEEMDPILTMLIDRNFTNIPSLQLVMNNKWRGEIPTWEITKMNITRLQNFTYLRKLIMVPSQIQQHFSNNMFHQHFSLHFNKDTFVRCNNIQELYINIPIIDTDLESMIAPLKELVLLDFNNIRGISYRNMNKTMQGLSNETIEILHLSRFQTIGQTEYLNVFIIKQFLVGEFRNLRELDLSNNGFALMYAGFFIVAPQLQLVDISHNLLTYDTNAPVIVELLMHPTIKYLNISHQGYSDDIVYNNIFVTSESSVDVSERNVDGMEIGILKDVGNPQHQWQRDLKRSMVQNSPYPITSYRIVQCVNNATHGNISRLFGSDTRVLCYTIRHCTLASFNYFSCDYLPTFNEMYDVSCNCLFRFPIGPSITKLNLENNFFDIIYHNGLIAKGKLCMGNNSLEEINFASNYYWANTAKIGDSVSQLNNVQGTEKLRTLNMSNNEFNFILTGGAITFPNLQSLDMSWNMINISSHMSLCRDKDIHSLEHFDLGHNELTVQNISDQIIVKCEKLVFLGLAGNNLCSSFTLNFTDTPSLRSIDLSHNQLTSLNPEFMREISLRPNLTIEISGNKLLCGCTHEDLELVKWTNNPNFRNKIIGFDDLSCTSDTGIRSLKSVKYYEHWANCYNVVPIAATVIVTLLSGLALLLTVCGIKFRYRIRHKIFKIRQRFQRGVFHPTNTYEYDAYVGITEEDHRFNAILAKLEAKHGFRLALRNRDIPLGTGAETDLIMGVIENCRKYIVVWSPDYQSHGPIFTAELQELNRLAQENDQKIVFISLSNELNFDDHLFASRLLDHHGVVIYWNPQGLEGEELEAHRKLCEDRVVDHIYSGARSCSTCCVCPRRNEDYVRIEADHNEKPCESVASPPPEGTQLQIN